MKFDVKDVSLAAGGKKRIEWADNDMPSSSSSANASQGEATQGPPHERLPPRHRPKPANLARTLKAGGADLVLVASNPLSTQDDVAAALSTEYRRPTFAIKGEDNATYYRTSRPASNTNPTSPWTTAPTSSGPCTKNAPTWPRA